MNDKAIWRDGDERQHAVPSLTPVVEYMGVALSEGGKGHKVVWEGTEYETDGNCYIISKVFDKDGTEVAEIMVVPPQDGMAAKVSAERAAKDIIENMSDLERDKAFGIVECFQMCHAPERALQHKEWVANGGRFEWDDEKSVFIRTEPEMFGQGKTR